MNAWSGRRRWLVVAAALGFLAAWTLLPANAALGGNAAWSAERNADPCVGADCGVVTDPDGADYVGTGGLLLPGDSFTGTDDDRAAAAECAECRWALMPMCRGDGQGQGGTPGGGVECGPAASSCPPGEFRRIVLLLRPGAPDWEEVGLVCIHASGPTTVSDVADHLHDVVIEGVPPQSPSSQPRGGTLVQLPAIFDSGQPRMLGARQFDLVGFAIELQGRATWVWSFGDGISMTTDEPGGSWPNDTVAHTYTESGSYPVTLSTEWEAWFTVDGFGPFPVSGDPVVQVSTPFALPVQEARAQLIIG
ncbi:MAG TPA: PKD domain-containing protein [Actinomycetes bacterium]|nr:PKD domain-containing protein [Actinomycetes bacterium]